MSVRNIQYPAISGGTASLLLADLARELETAAKKQGIGFLDAPVSGGQAGAENGVLTVMVGGAKATFKKAEPVLSVYARAVTLLGPAGSGQLTKMVNQICITALVHQKYRELQARGGGRWDTSSLLRLLSKQPKSK